MSKVLVDREVVQSAFNELLYANVGLKCRESLRAALEQPGVEPVAKVIWPSASGLPSIEWLVKSNEISAEMLLFSGPQPAQQPGVEPVAWRMPIADGTWRYSSTDPHVSVRTACEPLYTAPKPAQRAVSKDCIRKIFLEAGFTIKEGQTDLKPYVYEAAYALLNEATQPAQQSCPACGSDCNERDELIKAEREIERLHAENEALRASLERCKEVAVETASCWNDDTNESEALLHQTRTAAIQACIDRLIQGGKPAEAGMLRHHFAKDLGEG